jgi:hypothetical protein
VVSVEERVVFGALGPGATASPSDLERRNATDRHRNARKERKAYRFSKAAAVHGAITDFTPFTDHFCGPLRTLGTKDEAGRWAERTPAMAAGLADHVWTLEEWLILPGVQR